MLPFYEISLPLPTSVNASHAVGKGFWNNDRKKWERVKTRSSDYNDWTQKALQSYHRQFPHGVQKLTGRLAVHYIFIWNMMDKGRDSSDIGNREKVLSDFLEHKFFDNDAQIDEQHQYRRISPKFQNCVWLRVYEIPDRRYDVPELIFNPVSITPTQEERH